MFIEFTTFEEKQKELEEDWPAAKPVVISYFLVCKIFNIYDLSDLSVTVVVLIVSKLWQQVSLVLFCSNQSKVTYTYFTHLATRVNFSPLFYQNINSRARITPFFVTPRQACFSCFLRRPYRCTNLTNGTPIWGLRTKLYKGGWTVSANNSEFVVHKDLRLGQIVHILVSGL